MLTESLFHLCSLVTNKATLPKPLYYGCSQTFSRLLTLVTSLLWFF